LVLGGLSSSAATLGAKLAEQESAVAALNADRSAADALDRRRAPHTIPVMARQASVARA
jgi:hypothetical protein